MVDINVEQNETYNLTKLLGITVTGYTETLTEPGDFFIKKNQVYYAAGPYVPGGDNTNDGTEIRYLNNNGDIASRNDFVFVINEDLPAIIDGNKKDNLLGGTNGFDQIRGFGGDDSLVGRGGDDILTGGKGSDNFNIGHGFDTITDWNSAQDEMTRGSNQHISLKTMRQVAVVQDGGTLLDFDKSGATSDGDVLLTDFFF